jgi:hypothetical protein
MHWHAMRQGLATLPESISSILFSEIQIAG